jgi:uroporphyrinogen decarboxylase
MIERGLDVLQSLQPEAADMKAAVLKRDFGDRLAFHGGISIQRTLPFGNVQDVRDEVRERIDALAPRGGYILCTAHNIQADTPVENVQGLLDAHREFGGYC